MYKKFTPVKVRESVNSELLIGLLTVVELKIGEMV